MEFGSNLRGDEGFTAAEIEEACLHQQVDHMEREGQCLRLIGYPLQKMFGSFMRLTVSSVNQKCGSILNVLWSVVRDVESSLLKYYYVVIRGVPH